MARLVLARIYERDLDHLPSLPEELGKLEEQFKKGDIDVRRVFQARTSLVQLQRAYLDSVNELAQAAAALTAASGLPPQPSSAGADRFAKRWIIDVRGRTDPVARGLALDACGRSGTGQ